MLATLSGAFTAMAQDSTVLDPSEQAQVAQALEQDAEVMSNTQLEQLLVDQPADTREEILRINTEARPLALQVALLVPILAGTLGFVVSLRMRGLPDPQSSRSSEGLALG